MQLHRFSMIKSSKVNTIWRNDFILLLRPFFGCSIHYFILSVSCFLIMSSSINHTAIDQYCYELLYDPLGDYSRQYVGSYCYIEGIQECHCMTYSIRQLDCIQLFEWRNCVSHMQLGWLIILWRIILSYYRNVTICSSSIATRACW